MAEIDYGPIIAGMRAGAPGPPGGKGDPGIGWNPVALPVSDLNNLTAPGTYQVSADSTSLNRAGTHGTYIVFTSFGNRTTQIFFPQTTGSGSRFLQRGFVTGYAWSAWTTNAPNRVDNTAGRAMYAWDESANREQLIYGDTGWRNVKENLLPDFTASSIRIRRTGSMVTVGFDGLTGITSGHATFLPSIAGFAADSTLASAANQRLGPIAELTGANIRWVSPEPGAGALRILSYVANASMHGFFTYFTADPWPTVLPGIPNGPTSSPA